MNKDLTELISKYFEKSIVIVELDKFNSTLENINRNRPRELSQKDNENLFKLILENIDFFKKRLSINGLTLNNLFDYTYKAKYENGECKGGSGNRRKITKDLHYVLEGVEFTTVEDIFPDSKISGDFAQKQLYELIGLRNIKKEVEALTALAKIRKQKISQNIPVTPSTLHMIFSGNPGTGKTTVARLIGAIYKDIGLLEDGQVIEVGREDIVEEYIGHTAKNVGELFKKAGGGVLFIDEAYTLNYSDSERDFGKEAINTMVKLMEDNREDLVVILAGYTNEMNAFLQSNPGLKSRFSWFINFEDYSSSELIEIFCKMVKDLDHILTDGAKYKLELVLENLKEQDGLLGNARDIRNIFEKTLLNQSKRLSLIGHVDQLKLRTIVPEDIPENK
jgi:SpoVK/Ycf46/Vps4 family AAA+-type ATPase